MSGTTHMAVGAAITVTIVQPKNIQESMIALACGVIGGIAPDVDTENATMARIIRSILAFIASALIILYKCRNYIDDIHIQKTVQWLFEGIGIDNIFYCLLFFTLLMIGSFTKHRNVTHSIEFIACQTVVLYFIHPMLALPFVLSALSHTALDILNRKKVKISLLINKSLSFGICKSNGIIDRLFLVSSMIYIFIRASL